MQTIADDLVLLAAGLIPRVGPGNGRLPALFPRALRGASLIALASAGKVAVDDGWITVLDQAPFGDPVLEAELAAMAGPAVPQAGGPSAPPRLQVDSWMRYTQGGFATARFERLADLGLLRGERFMLMLMVPRTGYRLADENATRRFEALRAALHQAVTATGPLDSGAYALAGLAYAGQLSTYAYRGSSGAKARARLAEIAKRTAPAPAGGPVSVDGSPIDPSILFASAAVHASVASTVHAAVSSAASPTHHHASGSGGSVDSPPTTTIIRAGGPGRLRSR